MLKPEIKFQCEQCHGIVLADLEDDMVNCGHCHAVIKVPHKLGPGVVVDDFVLLKRVGTGGMGKVYLAHQFSLERECALKILMDHYVEDKYKNDFIIEARSVAKLNHLNIVKAYKVGVDNGIFFFAMEYVEGQNLKDILRKKKTLSQDYVIKVAIEMARALGYAWKEEKLVHRDIKPDNIVVAKDGTAKLMDLGLCRPAHQTEEDSEIVSGTPQYISPEQIIGASLDIRSDFYSLGATLYHLLTGKFVFNGSVDEIIDKHLENAPKSISTYKPQINSKLDELILKLLSKKPENRYQDAESLENDLLQIQENFRKAKKAAASGTQSVNKKGLSEIAQRDSKFNTKHLIAAIAVLGLFLIASMVTLAVTYNSKSSENNDSNKSVIEDVNINEEFISDAEIDENNALNHPDLLKSLEVAGDLKKGLNYYYFQKWGMESLEEINSLKPMAEGKILLLDLDFRKRSQHFAFVFDGYLEIPHTNTYKFFLSCNDSAKLIIDDKEVVSASIGFPSEVSTVLEKGLHKVSIKYFQKTGDMSLGIEVSSPRIDKQKLPYTWFKRKDLH